MRVKVFSFFRPITTIFLSVLMSFLPFVAMASEQEPLRVYLGDPETTDTESEQESNKELDNSEEPIDDYDPEDEEDIYYIDPDEDEDEFNPFSDLIADTLDVGTTYAFLPPSSLPVVAFLPATYDELPHIDSIAIDNMEPYLEGEIKALDWLRVLYNGARSYKELKTRYMLDNIPAVKYNINSMPKPPKKYTASVDPSKAVITVTEIDSDKQTVTAGASLPAIARKHWLQAVNASLQFSQAYISPNWYQGGINNVNGSGNLRWNVKLNPKFHPDVMFEATTQYKLAMASAPNDTVHSYLISEDQFQFNATAGVHAFKHWYYSLTTMFKTQLFNNYKGNSRDMKAAFLSPGELNVGVGMTYNYTSPKKKFVLDASIAPISYNMKMSTNRKISVTSFGIKEGHRTVSEVGSNAEVRMKWEIMWNITYTSRFFVFTDYDYLQADWENTFNFSFNRYLSTQLYIHPRFDSSRSKVEGTKWHKWQLKEILSFGLQYQFKTI